VRLTVSVVVSDNGAWALEAKRVRAIR